MRKLLPPGVPAHQSTSDVSKDKTRSLITEESFVFSHGGTRIWELGKAKVPECPHWE